MNASDGQVLDMKSGDFDSADIRISAAHTSQVILQMNHTHQVVETAFELNPTFS